MPKPKSTDAHSQSPRRRSPRLILLHENNNNNPTTPKPKSTNNNSSIQSTTLTVPSLRRSARFSNQNALDDVKLTEFSSRVKQGKTNGGGSGCDDVIGIEVGGKRKTKRVDNEIVERSKNESGGAKEKRKCGGDEILEGSKKEPVEEAKEKRKHGGDDEIVEESKKEPVEGGAKGKRKHKHACSEIAEGWTKEQELALRKAYFTAKPTPHFWKNVSKMVCSLNNSRGTISLLIACYVFCKIVCRFYRIIMCSNEIDIEKLRETIKKDLDMNELDRDMIYESIMDSFDLCSRAIRVKTWLLFFI
jgi:hypothetical protein